MAIALEAPTSRLPALSTRQMAEASGVSHNSVHQIWRSFEIKPHSKTTFNLSADPLPIDKVWDVIGLYLKPPVHVLVVCIDEKSHVEAAIGAPPRPPRRPTKAAEEIDGTDAHEILHRAGHGAGHRAGHAPLSRAGSDRYSHPDASADSPGGTPLPDRTQKPGRSA